MMMLAFITKYHCLPKKKNSFLPVWVPPTRWLSSTSAMARCIFPVYSANNLSVITVQSNSTKYIPWCSVLVAFRAVVASYWVFIIWEMHSEPSWTKKYQKDLQCGRDREYRQRRWWRWGEEEKGDCSDGMRRDCGRFTDDPGLFLLHFSFILWYTNYLTV